MVNCEYCNRRMFEDEAYSLEDDILCESCYDELASACLECGEIYNLENMQYNEREDSYYCNSCYEYDIHYDYSTLHGYKESPRQYIIHGEPINNFKIGVELEMDKGGDRYDCIYNMADVLNESAWFEHDGSLYHGMELITHPMSFDYAMDIFPWDKIQEIASNYEFKSHDTNTCGLHIHIDRLAFGVDKDNQDLNIAKLAIIFSRFWEKLVIFSRRDYSLLKQWAKKPSLKFNRSDGESLIIAKSQYDRHERYKAINISNSNTVEIRIFRGTLLPSTIKATIQLIKILVDYVNKAKLERVFSNQFRTIVKSNYTELNDYLKLKGLM